MTKTRWLGLGLGMLFILAAFGVVVWQSATLQTSAGTALTQSNTPTPTPNANAPTTKPSAKPSNNIGDTFWDMLAAKLGIKADDLKAKALEVRKEMLDQAVKDGKLTQAQADNLKQKLDSNGLITPIYLPRGGARPNTVPNRPNVPPSFRGAPGRGFFFDVLRADELEALAKVLNLKASDLAAELRGGKTLADVAKAQNVSEGVVKQAMMDTAKAQIDRELADGFITQAQADNLKAKITADQIDLSKVPFRFNQGQK